MLSIDLLLELFDSVDDSVVFLALAVRRLVSALTLLLDLTKESCDVWSEPLPLLLLTHFPLFFLLLLSELLLPLRFPGLLSLLFLLLSLFLPFLLLLFQLQLSLPPFFLFFGLLLIGEPLGLRSSLHLLLLLLQQRLLARLLLSLLLEGQSSPLLRLQLLFFFAQLKLFLFNSGAFPLLLEGSLDLALCFHAFLNKQEVFFVLRFHFWEVFVGLGSL